VNDARLARALLVSVAFVWLATGVSVVHPYYREIGDSYLGRIGLPSWIMVATCAFEVALGLRVALGRASTWLVAFQLALVLGFTTILGVTEPLLLAHPFGVLSKNLPLLAALGTAWLVEREGFSSRAERLLRVGMASIWITEGLFPKILFQQSMELEVVRRSGLVPVEPSTFLLFMGAAQVASGIAVLVLDGRARRALLACQAASLLVLPLLVALPEPTLFVHPFGPMTKNVPILAGTVALVLASERRLPFLTARWRDLFLVSWNAPAELLTPHLPPGCELDLLDGKPVVSFVSLDFEETRVFGIGWPGHRAFPDVNLRFYVRRGDRRGVVFLRELCPNRLVAWVARAIYGEPFVAAPIASSRVETDDMVRVERVIRFGGRTHAVLVEATRATNVPGEATDAHFLKERGWGFSRDTCFEVRHPLWEVHEELRSHSLEVDFAQLYGPEWAWLGTTPPRSLVLARGSEVEVYPREKAQR
jgi:uncharacterized protein YqjF (DUF2071 family)